MKKSEIPRGRTSGAEAGFPGPDVQNRAGFCPPGAGCPAGDPDVRPDGPDVRPMARMSGPTIPDLNRDFQTRLWAEFDDFGGKI